MFTKPAVTSVKHHDDHTSNVFVRTKVVTFQHPKKQIAVS